ncbi:MAG: helix-turn-helix domain-containing protein [Planctomycetes bacterium]|nr:helix-turn-helix domain-containing protein [Planctomycetota bacterium]
MQKKVRHKKKTKPISDISMLSVQRISEMYGFHPNTVRAWVNKYGLSHVKRGRGGKVFIQQDDVERYIKMWYEEG